MELFFSYPRKVDTSASCCSRGPVRSPPQLLVESSIIDPCRGRRSTPEDRSHSLAREENPEWDAHAFRLSLNRDRERCRARHNVAEDSCGCFLHAPTLSTSSQDVVAGCGRRPSWAAMATRRVRNSNSFMLACLASAAVHRRDRGGWRRRCVAGWVRRCSQLS